jgi:hypothetical protein
VPKPAGTLAVGFGEFLGIIMELFIKLTFWLGVVCFTIRIIEMTVREWPEEREPKSLGQHVAETILGVGITIWAGILLYGH